MPLECVSSNAHAYQWHFAYIKLVDALLSDDKQSVPSSPPKLLLPKRQAGVDSDMPNLM